MSYRKQSKLGGYNNTEEYNGFGASQKSGPRSLWGLIRVFIVEFFRSIPFSVRALLRKDMGSMTFSWVNILFATLWVRFILDGTYSIDEFALPAYIGVETLNPSSGFYYLFLPLWYLGMFFGQFGQVISNFIPEGIWTFAEGNRSIFSYVPFLLSCAILVIGIEQKHRIKLKHDRKISFDPMSPGISLFFESLLERLPENKREKTLFWIEFGLLLFFASVFYFYRSSVPELVNYAAFFAAGAIGHLIEYQAQILKTRREIEYRLASEYRAKSIQKAYEEYGSDQGGGRSSLATVSFAGQHSSYRYTHSSTSSKTQAFSFFNRRAISSTEARKFALRNRKYIPFLLIPLLIWLAFGSSKEITNVGDVNAENLSEPDDIAPIEDYDLSEQRTRERSERERQREEERRRREAQAQRRQNEEVTALRTQLGSGFGGGGNGSGNSNPTEDNSPDSATRRTTASGTISGLGGRSVLRAVPAAVENSQMSGTVVIGMCVNESGSVTEAEFKQGGSSTSNIQLVEAALHSARSYKFNSGTVDKQCGEITYRFRVQ